MYAIHHVVTFILLCPIYLRHEEITCKSSLILHHASILGTVHNNRQSEAICTSNVTLFFDGVRNNFVEISLHLQNMQKTF